VDEIKPGVGTSRDGVAWSWASFPAGATGRILAATHQDGSFVAVGSGLAGVASWYSANGVTWTVGEPIEDGTGGLMLGRGITMTWRPLAILAVIAVILGGCSATQPNPDCRINER
jgi:hypothetical protein